MRYPNSVVAGMQHGQAGWRLRWRVGLVLLSHWFADRDEALTVLTAMRAGQTFEQALKQVQA